MDKVKLIVGKNKVNIYLNENIHTMCSNLTWHLKFNAKHTRKGYDNDLRQKNIPAQEIEYNTHSR